MSDKVLRTRRIHHEDRVEAVIALLRAEVRAWRDADARHDLTRTVMGDGNNDEVLAAMRATDAAKVLEEP